MTPRLVLLMALAGGCLIQRPIDESQVLPRRCDSADCGPGPAGTPRTPGPAGTPRTPGRCTAPDGEASCECAPGWAPVGRFTCVKLYGAGPRGCTSPDSCSPPQVCERLTGRCVDREARSCGAALLGPRGSRKEGDYCINASAPETSGCSPVDTASFCSGELVCTPTGPSGHSGVICGYPTFRSGVCRTRCDPCSPTACPAGQACFHIADIGGICMPDGYSTGECGMVPCAPGDVCMLSGVLGGYAHGFCERDCSRDPGACGPKQQCTPTNPDYPDIRVCRTR